MKHAKTVEALAKALELDSKIGRKQITEWLKHPEFPKPTKQGWRISECETFATTQAREVAKKKYVASLVTGDRPPTTADLRYIQKIGVGATGYPESVQGLAGIARIIADHFKIRCQRQDVHQWRKATPIPFPPPGENNFYPVSDCLDWVESHIVNKRNGSSPDIYQRAAEADAQRIIEDLDHERFRRAVERGEYVDKKEALRVGVGVLKRYHGFVRQVLERNDCIKRLIFLRNQGMTENVLAEFGKFDNDLARDTVDAIEQQCEKAAVEVAL